MLLEAIMRIDHALMQCQEINTTRMRRFPVPGSGPGRADPGSRQRVRRPSKQQGLAMPMRDGLERFIAAQVEIYDQACEELHNGRKRSHWMWFIFPQMRGLGRSEMAHYYGVIDADEARAYLAHPVLGQRLRHCMRLLARHRGRDIRDILGVPDDLKSRSSFTLFEAVAEDDADRNLFAQALADFHGGRRDARTLERLAGGA